MKIEAGKLLLHNLYNKETNKITSVITYQFDKSNNHTVLSAREELFYDLTDAEYKDADAGWDAALSAVKEIAEKL